MRNHLMIHPEVGTTPCDDDGSVLINLQSGKVFSLNGVAAKVWTMLEQGTSFENVLDTLEREYRLPRAVLRTDLDLYLSKLEQMALVQVPDRQQ